MALTVYPGETVRITAADLTHSDSGPVTTGATVTIALYDADGTISGEAVSGAVTGADWSADVTAPATVGEYTVKVTATKSGATWKGKEPLSVKAF